MEIARLLKNLDTIAERAQKGSNLNTDQKQAHQLPALFRPKNIRALTNPTDPQHPAKDYFVGDDIQIGVGETPLEEMMHRVEEDMLNKTRRDLSQYLDMLTSKKSETSLEDTTSPAVGGLATTQHTDGEKTTNYAAGPLSVSQRTDTQGNPVSNKFNLDLGTGTISGERNFKTGTGSTVATPRGNVNPNDLLPTSAIAQSKGVDMNKFNAFQAKNPSAVKENPEDPNQQANQQTNTQTISVQPSTGGAPGVSGSIPIKTMTMEDGTVFDIYGNVEEGYTVGCGRNRVPRRFESLDHAVMATNLFKAYKKRNMGNQDYIEER